MLERETILVADPDPKQVSKITHSLRACPRILPALNLAEARQLILTRHPTMLILELNQPDGDGLNFVRQIRQNPQMRRMLIICVTDRSSIRDKVSGFQAGIDDYIVKPIIEETFPTRLTISCLHRDGGGLSGTREPRRPYPPDFPPRGAARELD